MSFQLLDRPLPQSLPVFDATPESLRNDARNLVEQTQKVWKDIVNTVKPGSATFNHVIEPIIRDENAKSTSMRLLRFYASTSPSKNLRDASNAVVTKFTDSEVDLFARADVYALVDAVVTRDTLGDSLSVESRIYLEKLHRKFTQNGCGITDTTIKAHFEIANSVLRIWNANATRIYTRRRRAFGSFERS